MTAINANNVLMPEHAERVQQAISAILNAPDEIRERFVRDSFADYTHCVFQIDVSMDAALLSVMLDFMGHAQHIANIPVTFVMSGYDDDKRELWEIPEVCVLISEAAMMRVMHYDPLNIREVPSNAWIILCLAGEFGPLSDIPDDVKDKGLTCSDLKRLQRAYCGLKGIFQKKHPPD